MTQSLENYYNFTAHNVFTLPESTDKVFAGPDKLLVTSSTKLTISVHDLGSKGSVTHELTTKAVVRWAEYCVVNNHIVTIEDDDQAYIYYMWWSPEQQVRYFGSAKCAAWCHNTGRLALSDGNTVTIYDDLQELFKFSGFCGIEEVALCENILVVRTSTHVLAVNLHEEKYPCREDEIIWNFDEESLIINGCSLASPPLIDKPHPKTPFHVDEIYRPDRPIYGLNVRIKNVRSDSVYQPKVVLFKKIQPKFMALIAYRSCTESTRAPPHPLAEPSSRLDFISLILTDNSHCELFCVAGGGGKGRLEFIGRVESVAVDECFMHVLKCDSLATYALPLPGLSNDWTPFHLSTHRMNMKQLLMSRDYLIVLSDRQQMTVYSLLKPTTSEFYADIANSADKAALQRAKNIVRLQCRIYGDNCSQRLLSLHNEIERDKCTLTLHDILDGDVKTELLEEIVANSDQNLILKDGCFTEIGERIIKLHPQLFAVVLAKNDQISPKLLRNQMTKASAKMAVSIARHVCGHLGRIEGVKIHRKLLQSHIPPWIYELHPFNGSAPDPQCNSSSECRCLRCTGALLYAAIVLSTAPISIRLKEVLNAIPNDAPDILRLACLLPMTKTSSADPQDYLHVVDDIVTAVRPYTAKDQVVAPHLLTVLSDVLSLVDFLRCVPESCPALVPWLRNGLMRQRAQVLKQEIVGLGEELRSLIP